MSCLYKVTSSRGVLDVACKAAVFVNGEDPGFDPRKPAIGKVQEHTFCELNECQILFGELQGLTNTEDRASL